MSEDNQDNGLGCMMGFMAMSIIFPLIEIILLGVIIYGLFWTDSFTFDKWWVWGLIIAAFFFSGIWTPIFGMIMMLIVGVLTGIKKIFSRE